MPRVPCIPKSLLTPLPDDGHPTCMAEKPVERLSTTASFHAAAIQHMALRQYEIRCAVPRGYLGGTER